MNKLLQKISPNDFWGRQTLARAFRLIKYQTVDDGYDEAVQPTVDHEVVRSFNRSRHNGAHRMICKSPFNSLYFDSEGHVTACCFNRTFLLGDVTRDSIDDIWNGQRAEELRSAISNYNFSKGCSSCQMQLEAHDFQNYGGQNSDFANIKSHHPTKMTFELHNICNLECIMCNGRFSNLIRKNREHLPPIKMAYGDKFLNELKPYLEQLEVADFLGGEPLMIKMNYDIWEHLLTHNKNCSIYITTNGTILSDKFKALLNAGHFNINLSVDSLQQQTFEAIRINGDFDHYLENIAMYKELHHQGKIALSVNICPLRNNWEELPAIISHFTTENIPVYINNVTHPKHLSLLYLSHAELTKMHRQLNDAFGTNKVDAATGLLNRIFAWSEIAAAREAFLTAHKNDTYETLSAEIKAYLTSDQLLTSLTADEKDALSAEVLNKISNRFAEQSGIMAALYLYELKALGAVELAHTHPDILRELLSEHLSVSFEQMLPAIMQTIEEQR